MIRSTDNAANRELDLWVVTPSHSCDPALAIAANRSGRIGLLDLGHGAPAEEKRQAVAMLREHTRHASRYGVRSDRRFDGDNSLEDLKQLLGGARLPWLLLAGAPADADKLSAQVTAAREIADRVAIEATDLATAESAAQQGVDAIVLKGHEASGAVAIESSFLLLQRASRLEGAPPVYLQGGVGPDTAAAALLAGAAGVVLREQLWLTRDSNEPAEARERWARLDGSETVLLSDGKSSVRLFGRADRADVLDIEKTLAAGGDWLGTIGRRLAGSESDAKGAVLPRLVEISPDVALASRLAERHVTAHGVLEHFARTAAANLAAAAEQQALAQGGPLAERCGVKYPILQGPMTRVSDVAPFCDAVAEGGGLPFLALALLRGPAIKELLEETAQRLGDKPWGVGLLGFVPKALRDEQLAVVEAYKPPFAIVAGGRPSQTRRLEALGTAAYLHVPSAGLLETFVRDGARRFIFEGRECGGHVGPRTSFTLWQSVVDALTEIDPKDPESFELVFAGGIHDGLSAAMVAAIAAPLAQRGMKVGVLMGSAYLFTHEAVECGAIAEEFQRQAIACHKTVLLESGFGHATRCAPSPFCYEFEAKRRELVAAGVAGEQLRMELEMLNVGRLRLASKGVERRTDENDPDRRSSIVEVDQEEQVSRGMYMIGQVAALRDKTLSVAELHTELCEGAALALAEHKPKPAVVAPPTRRRDSADDIAIVGMAGIFPKADSIREYWSNIVRGVDAIIEVPENRWDAEEYFDPDRRARDKVYSKWGGFLGKQRFDPMDWGMPPASLASIDTVQLLALDVAHQAMQDAGYTIERFNGAKAGVVFAAAGIYDMGADYAIRSMLRHYTPKASGVDPAVREQLVGELEDRLIEWTEDSFPGFLLNVVAGRIANRLDFDGPNYTVDAACAASLAGVTTAIEQLRSGSCDAMLVGAVDVTNNPFTYMSFAKTHALSPRGKSRPFDHSADGIALGESVSATLMKRLGDAERDGDRVYAVIRGVGASSDGRNRSMTAPFPPGQMKAVRRAYEDAGFHPSTVGLIEAHGTGTAVGDASEAKTLSTVFAESGAAAETTAVGSVKSMIGHTKVAAGMSSLVKTALALHHKVLPPTLHVERPSPDAGIVGSPLYVNTETRPWLRESTDTPRRAGVSAFGFGGTNFHVALEEHTGSFAAADRLNLCPRPAEVFSWRAGDAKALAGELERFEKTALANTEGMTLAQLGQCVAVDGRSGPRRGDAVRLALAAVSIEDLTTKVARAREAIAAGKDASHPAGVYYSDAAPIEQDQVCFLYPGQGSQQVGMLDWLFRTEPALYKTAELANRATADRFEKPLSRLVYPVPVFDEESAQQNAAALNHTAVAQPALGMIEMAATEWLAAMGLRPGRTAGHSYGEYVALWAAGAMDAEQLASLSAARGQICAEASAQRPGSMASIAAPADEVERSLKEWGVGAHVANRNAPQQTVIGGPSDAVDEACRRFKEAGARATKLAVTAAFHTPELAEQAQLLSAAIAENPLAAPRLAVGSNTKGAVHSDEPAEIAETLARHLVEPVRFDQMLATLAEGGVRLFVEVGPKSVLTRLASQCLDLKPGVCEAMALDTRDRPNGEQAAHLLALCASRGLGVDLDAWYGGRGLSTIRSMEYATQSAERRTPTPTEWVLTPTRSHPANELKGLKHSAKLMEPAEAAADDAQRPKPVAAPAAPSMNGVARSEPLAEKKVASTPVSRPTAALPNHNGAQVSPNQARPLQANSVQPRQQPPSQQPPSHNLSSPVQPTPAHAAPQAGVRPPRPVVGAAAITPQTSPRATEFPAVSHYLQQPGASQTGQGSADAISDLMSRWFEMRHSEQRVMERFLELQMCAMTGQAPQLAAPVAYAQPVPAQPMPAQPIAPQAYAPQAVAPQPVAPAPMAPQPVRPAGVLPATAAAPAAAPAPRPAAPQPVTPAAPVAQAAPAVANGAPKPPSTNGAASNGHAGNGAPKPAAAAAAPAEAPNDAPSDAPPTEDFRRDLLEVTSQRTGYPTDLLDETMPLESGLGIDSIKTVEIFSNLKQYHPFLLDADEDEEEVLSEFAKLETLGDIVAMYDRRRANHGAAAPAAAQAAQPAAQSAETAEPEANGRHVVSVEEVWDDEKKKQSSSPLNASS
ncbi:Phenolphthiocerol synthesis polyketide synthase type I Pks15/1 [Pseudobythopirellula maris]|uniref:Phenolphthiocerol synthesis polyketide synthase type I Pks15/1 n=1 Tax=Pseudobythopirellula maris TaxID=2527991 RepID=A0A5C5ZKR4_9BACT|nr:type I polyketide synthase [Pseudobythopirellula maris]TWT87748.1 Phenolphthiocerol synthesis polyketide synthase type I Pks15/1 [Pseudobythopirellula maris]